MSVLHPYRHNKALLTSSLITDTLLHTFYVVVYLAAEQPLAGRLGHHLHCDEDGWEQAEDVGPVAQVQHGVAVEVDRVDIHLVAHSEEVPRHRPVHAHLQGGQVAVDVAVDSCGSKEPQQG